ncbi:bifunctional diaminohydroxyphosphoribosylaminopyrimidine deaminase/5-amino-6-(5-phosphoribosylamino)uracil reductase RibD [Leekyejoonella antrihumi]|uniref:Riboflavin biosynthesis protein RibD n=1 Tax=Leekyejoonella antrihumi TaxID=1660198 RepID=A0A563DXX9_9MICO|nr:bifunctional diaminohydroxyphosphoribosylaminopyrimidine deaminase/5-amino-6-(5-phosphoribosylamino)uracil reductase RibD [Leekyejoonella antrihumi]TWP34831.1 bifunctional diaminohydroxyphosphoribosylaminopyrimidine deaminase/5-amino-6-(5-phosphoribosylamino)uracil reductase RibD [Leekyejoonella antrihumi]
MAPPAADIMDESMMRAALGLAGRGPAVDPNPRVGCVLVVGETVVGQGWHAGAGTPHAEVAALSQARDLARGATAYVTLEPCAHTGRTGPCAQALIDAGVARVVFAQADPNPAARGGADLLAAHGVRVEAGLLARSAAALNRAWTFAVTHDRPMVTWKLATTLDGYAAAADGSSRWVTGAQARADVHRLRSRVGAVLVGTGTVLADDPSLTVRDAAGHATGTQPLRVVLGDRAIPATARALDGQAETLITPGHDPRDALKALQDRQIRHVLLEGGPTVAAAFLQHGYVDEIVAYVAPKLLGGGLPTLASLGIGSIADALECELTEVEQLGQDVRLRLTPTGRNQ